MHCADEVFEKPLPHLFEAAVFLMGFALWGKLEFNQRDGFLDCPHGDRVCGGGMVSKVVNATMFDRYLPFSCPLRYFRY